jgi:acetylornithine/N-succinyldiaminopimelate aminotransferase
MKPGSHGTTFGGNPLAMSVGNAVLDVIFKKNFLKNVRNLSKYFKTKLNNIHLQNQKVIKEVRGTGLLLGLQLKVNQAKFIDKLMKEKLLTIRAAENVVRILPPLNVSKKEIDQAVTIINKVCKSYK